MVVDRPCPVPPNALCPEFHGSCLFLRFAPFFGARSSRLADEIVHVCQQGLDRARASVPLDAGRLLADLCQPAEFSAVVLDLSSPGQGWTGLDEHDVGAGEFSFTFVSNRNSKHLIGALCTESVRFVRKTAA